MFRFSGLHMGERNSDKEIANVKKLKINIAAGTRLDFFGKQ